MLLVRSDRLTGSNPASIVIRRERYGHVSQGALSKPYREGIGDYVTFV